jgi:hypothetical protein
MIETPSAWKAFESRPAPARRGRVWPHEILLTDGEMLDAVTKGGRRHIYALKKKLRPADGAPEDSWNEHLCGALGELVVSKFFNVYWNATVGRLDTADVGALQVRTKMTMAYTDLILKRTDDDAAAFVNVLSEPPRFALTGWILGRDGKREEYWREGAKGRYGYFVPEEALNPDIEALRPLLGHAHAEQLVGEGR